MVMSVADIGYWHHRISRAEGASRLKASGFDARAYRSDAADLAMIRQTVTEIRNDLGPVSTVLWSLTQTRDKTRIRMTEAQSGS